MGVEGMDTRALTRHIRSIGAMKAILSTEDLNGNRLVEKAKASPGLIGRDLVKEVSCSEPFEWTGKNSLGFSDAPLQPSAPSIQGGGA